MIYDNSYISDDKLYHHGVKGMHWGIRKDRNKGNKTNKNKSTEFDMSTLKLRGKTSSGEPITAVQIPSTKISRFMARHHIFGSSPEEVNNFKSMNIYNSNGDKIGNIDLYHESPTSLNGTWMTINPKYRGQGYATATMKMAEQYAKDSGATQMTLEVPGNAPDARHIYEKLGFEVTGVLTTPEEDLAWDGLTGMKKVF